MKKIKLLTLVHAVVLLSMSVPAQASEYTASKFINDCRMAINFNGMNPDSIDALGMGFCLGIIEGLRSNNYFLQMEKSKHAFCEPDNFTSEDLAKTFVKKVDSHPDLIELRGSLAILAALQTEFPCDFSK